MRTSEPIPCTMFGIFARLHLFALFCADVRSFCTICAVVLLMTLPKLAPVKEYETTELDVRSSPKKNARKQFCGGKQATTCQFVCRTRRHNLLRWRQVLNDLGWLKLGTPSFSINRLSAQPCFAPHQIICVQETQRFVKTSNIYQLVNGLPKAAVHHKMSVLSLEAWCIE